MDNEESNRGLSTSESLMRGIKYVLELALTVYASLTKTGASLMGAMLMNKVSWLQAAGRGDPLSHIETTTVSTPKKLALAR